MRALRLLLVGLLMGLSICACAACPWAAWSIGLGVAIGSAFLLARPARGKT